MDTLEYLQMLAYLFVWQIPLLIIACIGLRFAFARRQTLGLAFSWAKWGFGLLIAYSVVTVLLQVLRFSIEISARSGDDLIDSMIRLGFLGLAAYPLFIAGVALLARAVFLDRGFARAGIQA